VVMRATVAETPERSLLVMNAQDSRSSTYNNALRFRNRILMIFAVAGVLDVVDLAPRLENCFPYH
jgi:hypothetical protein